MSIDEGRPKEIKLSREVCFLLGGEAVLRAYTGSQDEIPDSVRRWEDIWHLRGVITEVVHSHPRGALYFSQEDLSTIEAVEFALGTSLVWSVVTDEGYLKRQHGAEHREVNAPWWLEFLRELSYGK